MIFDLVALEFRKMMSTSHMQVLMYIWWQEIQLMYVTWVI